MFSLSDLAPALGLLGAAFLLWRFPLLASASASGARRPVAIVVPARDEAASLPALLRSVLPQLRPGDELLVADDGSSDATVEVAHAGGARVVSVPPLPPGWTGKCWALHHGVASTRAPVLLMLDADVVLAPAALDRLARAADEHADALVTVLPYHVVPTPSEWLSLFPNAVSLAASAACTPFGPRLARPVAYGPVIAVTRSTLERAGGYAAVRGAIADDLALGRAVGRTVVAADRTVASFRMYPQGWPAVSQGWTKNLGAGARSTPWWITLLVVGWMGALAGGPFVSPWWYVAGCVHSAWIARRLGTFPTWAAIAYPLAVAAFTMLTLRSLLARRARWRGRVVDPRT